MPVPPRPPARRRAALGLAAAALLAAPGAAAAAGWAPGPDLGIAPGATRIDVAAAPDGAVTAAWVEPDGAGRAVVRVRRADALRRLLPPQAPAGTVDATAGLDVAVSDGGRTAVAWTDADDDAIRVALVGDDGVLGTVREIPVPVSTGDVPVQLALGDAGAAVVLWTGPDGGGVVRHRLARVPAGGAPVEQHELGLAGEQARTRLAAAPDGTAWAAWTRDGGPGPDVRIARLGADGGGPDVVSVPADWPVELGLDASAAGAAATWLTPPLVEDRYLIRGVRLPVAGGVLGAALAPRQLAYAQILSDPAVAPDGTVALAWLGWDGDTGSPPAGTVVTSIEATRIAPGRPSGPTATLAAELVPDAAAPDPGHWVTVPQLAAAPDGALLATWSRFPFRFGDPRPGDLRARRLGTDWSVGPATALPAPLTYAVAGDEPRSVETVTVDADAVGGGLVGVVTPDGASGTAALRSWVHDAVAPTLDVRLPIGAWVRHPEAFEATAADRTATTVRWELGDGASAEGATVTHEYARPGSYRVTVTATDAAGNVATRSHDLHVRELVGDPPPPVRDDPTPPARDDRRGGDPAPPPRTARAPARLRVASATRGGARVTVRGTAARSAGGRVAVAYRARIGRRVAVARASARIVRGRWAVTLRLRGRLARAGVRGATVVVSYAGDGDTSAGRASRAVTRARAAPRRRGADRRRR